MLNALIEKINNKEAIIGIVGLGYVGLPLMLRFAEEGFRVLGLDIDEKKQAMLKQGQSYIQHISSERIAALQQNIRVSTSFKDAQDVDALILCVPTPLNKNREPDLSFVVNAIDQLTPYLKKGQLLSLESTTYPGTTDEILKPRIESKGLLIGEDIFLVYSPEREDPGNEHYTTHTIPKVCGGITEACTAAGLALYGAVIQQVVRVSSTRVAEMTKLLENIHRSVNIGLVNELKILADKMGINIHEVIDAAATKPFGFVPYYPGPGIGGHCIPIDPFYLTWKAREYNMHTNFIELSGEINSSMPYWVVNKVADALNARERPIKNSQILLLGLAYKRNIDDMRESPSIKLMELLQAKGAKVSYSDPHVPYFEAEHTNMPAQNSVSLNATILQDYDCVVIATAHDAFDYQLIATHAKLIVDTRGVYKHHNHDSVVHA